jgi:hypothetical protein
VSPALPAGYDPQAAAVLAQLAALATQDPATLFLPDGWVMLKSFRGTAPTSPRAQGFYAKGPLNGTTTVVIAMGLGWPKYLDWYFGQAWTRSFPPDWLVADPNLPVTAKLDDVTTAIYGDVRVGMWANLGQAAGLPLVVTGMGMGGPLAQLAALDLLPGHKGPGGAQAPGQPTPCYAFSTAPLATPDFAAYYAGKVTCYTAWAGSPSLPVDFWPTEPGAAAGYAPLGQAVNLSDALIPPAGDDPWVERDGDFYVAALGGTPEPPPVRPAQIPSPPQGFDRTLAWTLARLCAVVYGRRQHPATGGGTLPAGYSVAGDLTSNGVVWGTLFTSDSAVVAAFRGPASWAEFNGVQAASLATEAAFLERGQTVTVGGGVLGLYTGPTAAGSSTTLQATLSAQLQSLRTGQRQVYLTGHDVGGALANLAAADLALNVKAVPVAAVYTFGASPGGNYSFTQIAPTAHSYQVARPGDFAPKLVLDGSYFPLDQAVRLIGTPAGDTVTQHSLTSYVALLNPFGGSVAGLSAAEETHFADAMVALALTPDDVLDTLPPLDGGTAARKAYAPHASEAAQLASVDAGAPRAEDTAAAMGRTGVPPSAYAVRSVDVSADTPLVLRAPEGGSLRVAFGQMTASPGAAVHVEGRVDLHLARLAATGDMTLSFVGVAGPPGAPGGNGPSAAPGMAGGTGGTGARGQDGLPGMRGNISLGTVSGQVRVLLAGGRGGDGGPGGAGGAGINAPGGPGGAGGDGGDGADGADVTVFVDCLLPGATIEPDLSRAAGGAGGRGGPGGPGSPTGPDGPPGRRGKEGAPGILTLRTTQQS